MRVSHPFQSSPSAVVCRAISFAAVALIAACAVLLFAPSVSAQDAVSPEPRISNAQPIGCPAGFVLGNDADLCYFNVISQATYNIGIAAGADCSNATVFDNGNGVGFCTIEINLSFMTLVIDQGRSVCSAALVSAEWVMTSPRCIGPDGASNLRLLLGSNNALDSPTERIGLEALIHPDYDDTTQENALALVRIASTDGSLQPAHLPTQSAAGTVATLASWGSTTAGGPPSTELLAATVTVATDSNCPGSLLTDASIGFCAEANGVTGCDSDAGAPLITRNATGTPVLIGSLSKSASLCNGSRSSFVDIAALRDWWEPRIYPATINADVSCLGTNGLVEVFVTNTAPWQLDVDLDIDGLSRSLSVATGATGRVAVSGRPDGEAVVERDGIGEVDSVTVSCDPPLTDLVASVGCLAGNGLVTVVVSNTTSATATFVVQVGNVGPRSVELDPNESSTVRVSGRPDGDLLIAVGTGGLTISEDTVTVDCDPPTSEVAFASSCLAGNGRVDVQLANNRGATFDYEVTIGSLAPRVRTLADGDTTRVSATGRPDGALQVTVTRDGLTIATWDTVVACD